MLTTFNTIGLYTLFCNKWPEKTKVIGKTGLVIRRETPRDPVSFLPEFSCVNGFCWPNTIGIRCTHTMQ